MEGVTEFEHRFTYFDTTNDNTMPAIESTGAVRYFERYPFHITCLVSYGVPGLCLPTEIQYLVSGGADGGGG